MAKEKCWLCSCHCCGKWFPSARRDARLCGARCRKRDSRRNLMDPLSGAMLKRYWQPHYRCQPLWAMGPEAARVYRPDDV